MRLFDEIIVDRISCAAFAIIATLLATTSCGEQNQQSDSGPELPSQQGPNIDVSPNPLDFGTVTTGSPTVQEVIVINNTGGSDLAISRVDAIALTDGFAFKWPCERSAGAGVPEEWMFNKDAVIPLITATDASTRRTIDETNCISPVLVAAGGSVSVPIYYSAASDGPAQAIFRLYSNDPDFDSSVGEAYEIAVQANRNNPCISVNPPAIDFGAVIAGESIKAVNVTISNCGLVPLTITGIEMAAESSDEFSIDISSLGPLNASNPISIESDQSISFIAKYSPADVGHDAYGKILWDEGAILIGNNSANPITEVPVLGAGVEAECAVCEFSMQIDNVKIPDGAKIRPLDVVEFINQSYDVTVGGGIDSYQWTVKQPSDSVQVFIPASTYESPSFEPMIVGEYEFCLEVKNKDGCLNTCCQTARVMPPEGCHVELTWDTPSDPNQSDECPQTKDCGTDLDLHVVHPLAGESGMTLDPDTGLPYGFFDPHWDCSGWMNPHPTWDTEHTGDPLYQPNFDRDDSDGAGPEKWSYAHPDPLYSTTPPNCYKVGVHYYDDHSFGKSYPTIRVFVNSDTPVYEKTLTSGISMLDMWDAGRLCCSNTETPFLERVNHDNTPHVIHYYTAPFM